MFWDKKKRDSGLPDLPSSNSMNNLPTLREFTPAEDEREEIHELPSFPDSPMQRGFSQTAIKEAITNEDAREEAVETAPLEEYPSEDDVKTVEMEEWNPPKSAIPALLPMPEKMSKQKIQRENDHRPVYVRVDKFQNARMSLDTIRAKLDEIEELLKRIREVKSKEDAELSAWESDMENVKARIQSVMREIFDKSE